MQKFCINVRVGLVRAEILHRKLCRSGECRDSSSEAEWVSGVQRFFITVSVGLGVQKIFIGICVGMSEEPFGM